MDEKVYIGILKKLRGCSDLGAKWLIGFDGLVIRRRDQSPFYEVAKVDDIESKVFPFKKKRKRKESKVCKFNLYLWFMVSTSEVDENNIDSCISFE